MLCSTGSERSRCATPCWRCVPGTPGGAGTCGRRAAPSREISKNQTRNRDLPHRGGPRMNARPPGHFDFGLEASQEAHARELHRSSIVVDLLAQHAGGSNIFASYPLELQAELESRVARGNTWERLT